MTSEATLWNCAFDLVLRELVKEAKNQDMKPWLSIEENDLTVNASYLEGQIAESLPLREFLLSPNLMDQAPQSGIDTLIAELREILALLESGKHTATHNPL